jgi:hypothetical protein
VAYGGVDLARKRCVTAKTGFTVSISGPEESAAGCGIAAQTVSGGLRLQASMPLAQHVARLGGGARRRMRHNGTPLDSLDWFSAPLGALTCHSICTDTGRAERGFHVAMNGEIAVKGIEKGDNGHTVKPSGWINANGSYIGPGRTIEADAPVNQHHRLAIGGVLARLAQRLPSTMASTATMNTVATRYKIIASVFSGSPNLPQLAYVLQEWCGCADQRAVAIPATTAAGANTTSTTSTTRIIFMTACTSWRSGPGQPRTAAPPC